MLPGKDNPSLEPYINVMFSNFPEELYPELGIYKNTFIKKNDILIDGEPINNVNVEH